MWLVLSKRYPYHSGKLSQVCELKKITLNSCNVCADGCDDWIYFENGTGSHYIRFGKTDPKLEPLKTFIDKLNVIKSQYSKAP
jgi:hypothetical protein